MLRARDTSNIVTAHSPLPEIVESIDGHSVDDVTDKHPLPLVFAEDENGFINNGQPPAKRPRRVSSASSSARPEDLNRKEKMLDSHEWQAQRIVGERQTPSGMEYEIRVEKTVWLPRMTLHTKLVRRYRAEQRAATRVYTSGLMRKWMFDGFLWPKTPQVSRKSPTLFGQATIPEPSTPHIGRGCQDSTSRVHKPLTLSSRLNDHSCSP
jgi:hypothetical protein